MHVTGEHLAHYRCCAAPRHSLHEVTYCLHEQICPSLSNCQQAIASRAPIPFASLHRPSLPQGKALAACCKATQGVGCALKSSMGMIMARHLLGDCLRYAFCEIPVIPVFSPLCMLFPKDIISATTLQSLPAIPT